MLGGVEEVDEFDTLGKHAAQKRPVVLRPVGNLDQSQVRALAQHRLESALTMVLSVTFFDSGIRAIRTVESRSPSPSYNDTEAQLASRYPPPPVFIGAITPSSETATVHAVSATSSVSSRTLASNWGRCASQRAESALGSRSSELFEGVMLPNTPNTSSASRGTR